MDIDRVRLEELEKEQKRLRNRIRRKLRKKLKWIKRLRKPKSQKRSSVGSATGLNEAGW